VVCHSVKAVVLGEEEHRQWVVECHNPQEAQWQKAYHNQIHHTLEDKLVSLWTVSDTRQIKRVCQLRVSRG